MTLTLTNPESAQYNLCLSGFSLKGISAKGVCPKCKKPYKFNAEKFAFICPKHETTANRFLITVHYKSERIRRATNLDGETLETFAQAHALYNLAETEKRNKRFDPKKWKSKIKINYAFEVLLGKWLQEKDDLLEEGRRSPSYVSELPTYINRFFLPVYEGKDSREINNLDDLTAYLKKYLTKDGNPISLKYKKNIVECAQHFFKWLKKKKYIAELPDFPEPIEVPEHDPQTLSLEVRLQILSFIPQEHKPIFTWAFYQGCRPGEVRALKGDCILDSVEPRDTVKYKRTFSDNILIEHTKTKRIRFNYIFPEVRKILPEAIFPESFVFTHGKTVVRPYSKPFLNKLYRNALKLFNEANDTSLDVELYEATKHSFGTEWINQFEGTITIYDLQKWYGHTSLKSTEKYAKLNVVDVFRKVNNVISIEQAKSRVGNDSHQNATILQ